MYLGVCMWYKVTALFSCPLQALVFAQLCTLWVLAQSVPVRDFPGRELHLPSLLLSHPGACQGLDEEAPGDSHCFPVAQDETLQGRWHAGRCSGECGSCPVTLEVKWGSLKSSGQRRCLRPDAAGLFLLLPPVHPPPVSSCNQLWKVYWNFS